MRLSPPKNLKENILKWYVSNWRIFTQLKKNDAVFTPNNSLGNKCLDVLSGLTQSVSLNINGVYSLFSEYNNAPVFINLDQKFYAVGPGIPFGADINSLSVTDMTEVTTNPEYTIYRDGPYMLGKFGKNNAWSIIRVPNFGGDDKDFIDTFTLDIQSFNDNFEDYILAQQVGPYPPLYLKDNTPTGNKMYDEWVDSPSPLSRNWTINKKNCQYTICAPLSVRQSDTAKATRFFSTSSSNISATVTRESLKVESSIPDYEQAYASYLYLKRDVLSEQNSFVSPIINVLNIQIQNSDTNDLANNEAVLGYTLNGYKIININIHGHFNNITSIKSIKYGGEYIIDSVSIDIETDDEVVITNYETILQNEFKFKLNNNIVILNDNIEKYMSKWCKTSYFLYGPSILQSSWLDTIQDLNILYNSDSFDNLFKSKFTKLYFNNHYDLEYYDRVYESMSTEGLFK